MLKKPLPLQTVPSTGRADASPAEVHHRSDQTAPQLVPARGPAAPGLFPLLPRGAQAAPTLLSGAQCGGEPIKGLILAIL